MADHRVTVSLQLRWGDMDINRHINNVVISRLFEEARVRTANRLLVVDADTATTATAAVGRLVVARQEIEFHAPISYADGDVLATVWISRVGGKSFDLGSTLTAADGSSLAQAETTLVCVGDDDRGVEIAPPLADAMRGRLEAPVDLRSRRG